MLLPDRVEIGFDTRTANLVSRFLDILEFDPKATQLKIDALAKRLADANAKLGATVTANPDPNPND